MRKGGTEKERLETIRAWIISPKGQKKLDKEYKRTQKVVDDLVQSRHVDSETLYRPFTK